MQRKSLRSPLRSHRPRSQPREPGAHEVSFHVIVLLVVFLVVLIVSLFEGVLIKVKVVDGRVESKPNVENVFALEDAAISAEKRMLRGAVRVEEALGLDKDLAYAAKIAAPAVAAVRREAHLFADVVKHDAAFVEEEIEREGHVVAAEARREWEVAKNAEHAFEKKIGDLIAARRMHGVH
mmetsp:Transcript_20376/g.62777  ORF Transcript_20376/g.62777 Transcript_20376/m.62777 type:complete len:180 (+) Transcript_20376:318-857(+)